MHTPLYKKAFLHSWHLAWKQHTLWPLGLFASALGQMGIIDVLSQSWFTVQGYRPGRGWVLFFSSLREGIVGGTIETSMIGWVVFLSVFFLSLGLMFLFVSVVSQGALVDMTAQMVKRKKTPDIGRAWHLGVGHFWRVLVVNILKKVTLCLVGVSVVAVSLPFLLSTGDSPFVFLGVFLLASGVGIVVSFLAIYTVGYIVVEEYTFVQALRSAWQLFLEHWLVSFEVGVMIFFLNIVVACILVVGLFLSLVPAFFAYFFALLFSSGTVFAVGVALSATLFLLFFFLVASVFSVFVISTWTYLFMHMHKTGLKSHLLHWLRT
ncbi:MAG: hypothetical protein COV60_03320 [Candidatus Magasanikbacteria bacterium CG11_big_fil_rev_8_21_14_0_20_43_7]|uniref:Glycerophosphoryl diester phosphodiesterase membrane domain-containing protein n=1 Tax=Candidatus Magasanikbacteria bacterium CG11_big_fil_rev_8_21_14_0_20_43_7 TaxID=1974654 RepID=A0A2H0N1V3_9BACT|nr:MAG: hypothetical protein COV60_03320 [Candidatus Magasanikbacteria bacterium CG11_big_fil_rev_8_21_14_0_20_43_7]